MKTILIATDGSPSSDRALEFAMDLARGLEAKLEVLSVCPPCRARGGIGMHVFEPEELDTAKQISHIAAEKARAVGVDATAHAMQGDVVSCISNAATTLRAELLVTGSRGRGSASGAILGSVSNALVRRASVPVTIVRGAPFHAVGEPERFPALSERV